MNKSFVTELVRTQYAFIGSFALIVTTGSLYYGGVQGLVRMAPLVGILALVALFKVKRIKAKSKHLDERLHLIYHRALVVGFYFLLGAVLWFWTKEMALGGNISVRTYVELGAGLVGYAGSYFVLGKRY